MSKASDAMKDCVAAVREHERIVSRQRRIEASRRPVSSRRVEIDDLERERRRQEQDAELAMLEVLEVCGMVNASWTYARAKDDRLCRCVNRLLDV